MYEVGKMMFKTSIVYRLRFMSSIIISPLILFMNYFIWQAVFMNTTATQIRGYTFDDMIAYYVLSMIVGHFVFNMVGNKIQQKVIYGEMNQDLLRPMRVMTQYFSAEIGERTFAFFAEVIPVFIIALLLFNIHFEAVYAGFFLVAMLFGFIINYFLGFMMGILAFWIYKIDSIQWFMFFVVRFLSGEFIPLDFLGAGFVQVSAYLPFSYIRYGTIRLFLGDYGIAGSFQYLFSQLVWIVILYILSRILWNLALKKYGAVGG